MTSPNHSGCSIWTETVIELRERQKEEIYQLKLISAGLITEEELQTTMSNLGEPMNEMEVKAMIAEADLDGDGKINFKEFQILMENKTL